jgi:hypothetical protein
VCPCTRASVAQFNRMHDTTHTIYKQYYYQDALTASTKPSINKRIPASAAARGIVSSFGRAPGCWPSWCAEQVTGRTTAETLPGRCVCLSGSLQTELVGIMHDCAMLSGTLCKLTMCNRRVSVNLQALQ